MAHDTSLKPKEGSDIRQAEETHSGWHYRPNVDILELNDELALHMDMPGVAPDAIEIHYEKGILTLHGAVEPRQPADTRFLLREYGVGDFHRTFQVGQNIDESRISADYHSGVLTVHLPKSEAAKPRKIKVREK